MTELEIKEKKEKKHKVRLFLLHVESKEERV